MLAERYEREKVNQKRLLNNSLSGKRGMEKATTFQPRIRGVTSMISSTSSMQGKRSPYFEQQDKIMKWQTKTKRENMKKKAIQSKEVEKSRPQIERRPKEFKEGISGKTIEIDDNVAQK